MCIRDSVLVDFIRLEVKGEFEVVIYVVLQLEPCRNFSHARLFLGLRVFGAHNRGKIRLVGDFAEFFFAAVVQILSLIHI